MPRLTGPHGTGIVESRTIPGAAGDRVGRGQPLFRVLLHGVDQHLVDPLVDRVAGVELGVGSLMWEFIIWKSVPEYGASPVSTAHSRQPTE